MGALSTGIAAGQSLSTGNAIGDVIKGILATAKAKGLIQTQAQGNIDLARAKGEVGATKPVYQVQGGKATPVLDAAGNPFIAEKSARVITPREGMTEGERTLESTKAALKAQRIQQMIDAGEGNVIEASAAETAAPVSNMINQQEQAAPAQTEDEILNKWLDYIEAQ